jgi:hypothetical protein
MAVTTWKLARRSLASNSCVGVPGAPAFTMGPTFRLTIALVRDAGATLWERQR